MRRIATQRDQHPGNRGTLSALPGRRHAATWRDAPVDAYPGREDGQYSSEAVKEEIGNFARDFYQQDGEFRSYADAEEKYGDSPTAWDPFTWASVFEEFTNAKEQAGGGLVARRRTARRLTASHILDGYWQWCKQYGYDPEDADQYANQYAKSPVEADFIIDQIFDFDFVDGAADPIDFEEWVNNEGEYEGHEASRKGRRRRSGRRTATLTYDSFQESETGPIYTATGDNGVTYTINYFDAEYVKVTTSDGQDLGAFYNTDEAMKAVINHEQTGTTGDAQKRQ